MTTYARHLHDRFGDGPVDSPTGSAKSGKVPAKSGKVPAKSGTARIFGIFQ